MSRDVETLLAGMRNNPRAVRFTDLEKVCRHYFGPPRHHSTSHQIYKTPWPGDPRVNIQNTKGKAKPYQVRQLIAAIDRLTTTHHESDR